MQPRITNERFAVSESAQFRTLTLIMLFVLTIIVATTVGYLVGKSAGVDESVEISPDVVGVSNDTK